MKSRNLLLKIAMKINSASCCEGLSQLKMRSETSQELKCRALVFKGSLLFTSCNTALLRPVYALVVEIH